MKITPTLVKKVVKVVITILSAFLGALGGTTLGCCVVMAVMQI